MAVAEVARKVPVVALPVYFMPSVVRLATPAVKSPARLRTLEAWMPPTVPVNGATGVMVTLLAEASKVVTVLLPMSCA